MTLKTKIIGIMMAALVLLAIMDLSILRFSIYPEFVNYERQEALKDAARVRKAVEREIHYLDALCHDWSAWDDTYNFVHSRNPQYINVNLPMSSFTDNNLNLIYIVDSRGVVAWGDIYDLSNERQMSLERFPRKNLPLNHPLLNFAVQGVEPVDRSVSGLIKTGAGHLLVASRPVLTSDNQGPARGAVIMGRFLTDELVNALRKQTGVDFRVRDLADSESGLFSGGTPSESDRAVSTAMDDSRSDVLTIHTAVKGLDDASGILIQIEKPKSLSAKGESTLLVAVLFILLAGVVLFALIWVFIARSVVGPIEAMTEHMIDVAKTGDLSARLEIQRRDELGAMGNQYNRMLGLLEAKSRDLSDDIERRRVAEQALENQQEVFQAIVDSARDAIVMIDDEARISFWNQAGSDILGYEKDAVLGQDLHMLVAPLRFRDEYLKGFEIFRQSGGGPVVGKTVELMARHRDGHEVPVELSLASAQQGERWHAVGILRDITQRKADERALRESEERYRRVLETVPNSITISTVAEGRYLEVNDYFCRTTGFSREEALGRTPFDLNLFAFPEDRQRIVQPIEQKGEVNDLEIRYRRRDGSDIHSIFSARRIRYAGEDCIVSVVSDITDRKRAEEALAESEKRYRTLFEKAGDAIFIIETEGERVGIIANANQAAASMYGYGKGELVGKNMSRLFPPEVLEDYQKRYGETAHEMLSKGWRREEAFHLRRDGSRFPVDASGGIVELGGKNYIFAFHRDISDRKKAEEERLLLATAIEQSPDLVCITDTGRSIEYVNPAFETLTGFSRKAAIGKDAALFKGELHGRLPSRVIWESLDKGKPWKGRMTNRRQDGTTFEVESAISPVTNAEGKVIKYVSVERDITETIQQERQVRQTQKLEAIGTLAGGVAHDFNNILSGILGFTEIAMLELAPDSTARVSLEKVMAAANRAGDLVRQILAFSRKSEQEFKPTLVRIVVKEALKLCRATLPSLIEIQPRIQSDLAVLGDPTQIHQVVMNLCTNAGHAMEADGGLLTVALEDAVLTEEATRRYSNVSAGTFVKLSVTDTGCGIAPENLDRIFDPFFTTKEKGKGTGLGLSVVHGIAESHGGMLTVASRPGQGTTVTVYLPAIEAEDDKSSPEVTALPTGTERILFVDDEPFQTDLALELLGRLGYRVETENDSQRALERFRQAPLDFDLVMTDMTMPNLTGEALGLAVLAIRPDIPVILCTGYSERITQRRAESLGFRGFAMKPMVVRQIAEIVRKALDGNAPERLKTED